MSVNGINSSYIGHNDYIDNLIDVNEEVQWDGVADTNLHRVIEMLYSMWLARCCIIINERIVSRARSYVSARL